MRFRWLESDRKQDFLRAVQSEQGGVLVISGQSPLLEEEFVDKLLRETSHPLLILGGRGNSILVTPPAASESK